jgi:phenylacetate-CoA ligase
LNTNGDRNKKLHSYFYRRLYLSLQYARGRPVGAFMRQMQELEAFDNESYQRVIRNKLQQSLEYAQKHVPLYATGEWAKSLSGDNVRDIQCWPVLERTTVQAFSQDLLAQSFNKKVSYRQSSASTSKPVRVAWDQAAAAWNWSTEYQSMLWHGVDIGVKTIILWKKEERFTDKVLNRTFFSTKKLTEEELDRAAKYVISERPALAWGMPSAVAQLARYVGYNYPQARKPLVQFAKMGGEQVFPFQRAEITEHLGARVVEIYGCSEVGSIAGECPEGKLHVYTPHVHLEIFKDNEPAPLGEFGDIVGTTINNRAMPLVRYRIGDRGRISPEPCRCGLHYPVLEDLQGRLMDTLLATDGTRVHASAIGNIFDTYVDKPGFRAIRQVLFQQMDQHAWLVFVETSEEDDIQAAMLTEIVHRIFGRSCRVDIKFVPYIPREASGKFRYYRAINEEENGKIQSQDEKLVFSILN